MNDPLKGLLAESLKLHYGAVLGEAIKGSENDTPDLDTAIDKFSQVLAHLPPSETRLVQDVRYGNISPEQLVEQYRRLVAPPSRTAGTLVPYRPPYTSALARDDGRVVVYGPPSALDSMQRAGREGALPIVVVTTPPSEGAVPVISRFARVSVASKKRPAAGRVRFGDVDLIFRTPYTCQIWQPDKGVVGTIDLTRNFVDAVAQITQLPQFTDAFFFLLKTMHEQMRSSVMEARHLLEEAASHGHVTGSAYVLGDTLRQINAQLAPLLHLVGAARAFGTHPLSHTYGGDLIAAQVVNIQRIADKPLLEASFAPLAITTDSDYAYAATVGALAHMLGAEGMQGLFNPVQFITGGFGTSEALRESSIRLEVRTTSAGFGVFDPVALRSVIHHALVQAMGRPQALGNVGQPFPVTFFLHEEGRSAEIIFARPLPNELIEVIDEAGSKYDFDGTIDYRKSPRGVLAVIMRKDGSPESGGRRSGPPDTERSPHGPLSNFTTMPAPVALRVEDIVTEVDAEPPPASISGINELAGPDTEAAPPPVDADAETLPAGEELAPVSELLGMTMPAGVR